MNFLNKIKYFKIESVYSEPKSPQKTSVLSCQFEIRYEYKDIIMELLIYYNVKIITICSACIAPCFSGQISMYFVVLSLGWLQIKTV